MVIAGRTANTVSECNSADVFATRCNILVTGRGARIGKVFTANQISKRHISRQARRPIVGLGGRERDRLGVDRAGGVIGIRHGIVVAAVAVRQGYARYGHRLVASACVGVRKRKAAARQGIAREQRATTCRRRSCGGSGAVVGFGDVAGG